MIVDENKLAIADTLTPDLDMEIVRDGVITEGDANLPAEERHE